MSALDKLIASFKDIPEDPGNILLDRSYIKKSYLLVTDALQKGFDVAQLANGDLIITEVKTVTSRYGWNETKDRFEKSRTGSRVRRKALMQATNEELADAPESFFEKHYEEA